MPAVARNHAAAPGAGGHGGRRVRTGWGLRSARDGEGDGDEGDRRGDACRHGCLEGGRDDDLAFRQRPKTSGEVQGPKKSRPWPERMFRARRAIVMASELSEGSRTHGRRQAQTGAQTRHIEALRCPRQAPAVVSQRGVPEEHPGSVMQRARMQRCLWASWALGRWRGRGWCGWCGPSLPRGAPVAEGGIMWLPRLMRRQARQGANPCRHTKQSHPAARAGQWPGRLRDAPA
ncbi:hypothetical protein BS50DRAFT_587241 [Corynespora cassiicola Philippines]|uniref:Uncharacterized protein n=1 Tax=Corynespora cassiicola Philippines TaxID=1448308 RepID=A0A2T2NRM7_CORCC|nr:hypothetical protein BS50DRAFT_587241 [Corynespora cassiicola Philippines]